MNDVHFQDTIPSAPSVVVIVLNYNNFEDTAECVRSLEALRYPRFSVAIIDNASPDGSAAMIAASFPDVYLVTNKENKGFAAANNQVITHCRGRYILFLNPDTVWDDGSLCGRG
ncbi:MAG: glycosyltransferase [Ignavibacteriales bacterium]|nr:glycosyltransferase [Ignavibacteriales bacterium]